MSAGRYVRQVILPEVGAEGQARLAAAHALVVGAGGLGAPVLQYLAGAGVGEITVMDPDLVERGNLHRQPLFGEGSLGRPKAEAAAAFLRNLNPDVAVRAVADRLDPRTADARVSPADIVIDCADSFAASYTLSDACARRCTPLVSASVLGLSGYVGGFCGGAPSLRAVFPELPERAASCATAGVLGPMVGVLGSLQAQMALAIVLRLAPSPLGQLATVDGAGLRFGGFRFDGAPEPDDALRFLSPGQISAADFVVDLRGPEEAPEPVVPTARRHCVAEFGPGGPRPAPGQRAVLCCRSGLRSWQAARRLQTVWSGDTFLVALGDPPAKETP
jgi:molybdopterin/thiamine biosynthesis adenylyltransferase